MQNPCDMTKLKFYLDKRNKKRGEEMPLKLALRHNNTSAFFNTGIALLPSQWDERAGKVVAHPRRNAFNAHLEQMRLDMQERLLELMRSGKLGGMSASHVKKLMDNNDNTQNDNSRSFVNVFKRFMSEKEKPRTVEIYETTLLKIQKFCPGWETLSFEDITREWLMKFDSFMSATSPSRNARNIHLRNIRAVFNYAIDEDLTTAYPFRKFKIRPVATVKRSLTAGQLRMLFSAPVEPYAVKYLDMFKLIFFLIGVNIVDLCNLKEVKDGRIEYYRAKTNRLYSVKVEPEAMEIIMKYRGKVHLLDILDRYSNYRDYAKRLNGALQRIGNTTTGKHGKKVLNPLFPDITTYWARHSWATIAASLDIPKETISAALGHEIGSRITSIYIDFDQRKVDEANRKVLDYVLYGKL